MSSTFKEQVLFAGLILFFLFLAAFMAKGLYEELQFQGLIQGASISERTLTDKTSLVKRVKNRSTDKYENRTYYYVAWNEQSARQKGPNRESLNSTVWNSLEVGDLVEVISLPNGKQRLKNNGESLIGNIILFAVLTLVCLIIAILVVMFTLG